MPDCDFVVSEFKLKSGYSFCFQTNSPGKVWRSNILCYWQNIEQVQAATPPQGTDYTATCLPSRKLSKLNEPDMQDTTGEARTSSYVMYSYGPPHMAKQKQDDQLEHTYIQQLCEDTGCSPEDLPEAMNDRE